ncbi:MAG: cell division protein ZapB [Chitinispirillaceae bacterium]|nr:cell division protein ZapB [Chitinispirillaceae bacterium]
MDIKYLDELENRVQTLISVLESVKKENERLKQELMDYNSKISAMENENKQLSYELETLRTSTIESKSKLNSVAERIQGLLARLESVS